VFHRFANYHEAVGKHVLPHPMIRLGHVSWYCGTVQR
jgi:hypothetical protein